MAKTSYLPKKTITLLDGKEYTYRAPLPLTPKTQHIHEGIAKAAMEKDSKAITGFFIEALKYCFSFDNDEEEGLIDRLLEECAIPLVAYTKEAGEVMSSLEGSLFRIPDEVPSSD